MAIAGRDQLLTRADIDDDDKGVGCMLIARRPTVFHGHIEARNWHYSRTETPTFPGLWLGYGCEHR
jgi:hypothetical protein